MCSFPRINKARLIRLILMHSYQSYDLPFSFNSGVLTCSNTFTVIPKEFFRANNGLIVTLRDRAIKKTGSYNLLTEAGKVKPKALDPSTYTGRRKSNPILSFAGSKKPKHPMGRPCVPIPLRKTVLSRHPKGAMSPFMPFREV